MNKALLWIVVLLNSSLLFSQTLYINQIGYKPNSPKYIFFDKPGDKFFIHDAVTGKVVFQNTLILWKTSDPSTGLNLYKGDFGSFKQQGTFFITSNTADTSYYFNISDTVYNSSYNKMLKSYYFQRCGTALHQANAGPYIHPECHVTTDGVFHPTSGLTGEKAVTGGWHDAGDYGKYVINAGITVGTMLMAYEMFPERFSNDSINIPESGNKIPDLLDEVKYELEWLFKMQDSSGGVFTKVTGKNFEGFVMPQDDKQQRFIYQITSAATGDFAAVMARAYRNFYRFDPDYASKCLNAAESAWRYLENHPGIIPEGGFRNPSDTHTGSYADRDDSDERLWAATEIYIATGDRDCHNYFMKNYKIKGIFSNTMDWPNVAGMAHLTYLFSNPKKRNQTISDEILKSLENYCNKLVEIRNHDGLHITIQPDQYKWGSTSDALNKAILLISGYLLTNKYIYYETALDQLNYVLGVNPHNMAYVTGVGTRPPMFPHHRPSGSDNIIEPVPGLIIGGPNKNINNDQTLPKYYNSSTPPALCYIDEQASYASNETCINWNAPLVFVAGFFNMEK